jgi:shikimate dehydrogenase
VEHSLSPVLHGAAFAALGLDGWSYERIRCDERRLPSLVAGADADWVGFSVTMPGKRAALEVATEVTPRAAAVGAANTLVRKGSGWLADCTDVSGISGALRFAGGFRGGSKGVILGGGGTAAGAVAAFADLGVTDVSLVVRDPARAKETLATAERVGVRAAAFRWADTDFASLAAECDVLVSTVPPGAVAPYADALAEASTVLDVIYHPWPSPLAEAVLATGRRVATGLDMLLHQSFGQVEHFTGLPAPRERMRAALRSATEAVLELPID